eukprot:4199364-Alexandrium_andersonii.AAC.1
MGAEEGRALRAARDPAQPSDDERRRRECARPPFRLWRARCVRGHVPNAPRASAPPGTRASPE